MGAIIFSFLAIPEGHAQSYSYDLTLRDAGDSFNAVPYAYVTPDPGGALSYQSIIDNFKAGKRGRQMDGEVLNLGSTGVPHWIVLIVRNGSWTENWMLSFGQRMDGRMGVLKDISVYDTTNGTRYIDTVTASDNPYVAHDQTTGTAIKVNLAHGQRSVFVIYVVPQAGNTATLALGMVRENVYLEQLNDSMAMGRPLKWFFLLMTGFFVGAALFGRMGPGWLFIPYYALQFMLFQYNDAVLYTDFPWAHDIPGLLFCGTVLISLLAGRFFLNVRTTDRSQDQILLGFMIGIFLAAMSSAFIVPADSSLRIFGILIPAIGGMGFLVLLGIAQSYNGQSGARQFAAAWAVSLLGLLCSILSLADIIPSSSFLAASYWYAMAPQGLLFISATVTRFVLQERDVRLSQAERYDDAENLASLRQSKEAAENNRLKRLIEHEREVMNKLREREVKQNEEMRHAKDEADEANRSKSAFLAVISHEIRTPMSGIMGMVRLLIDSPLSAEQLDRAQTIHEAGDAMLALLNDILDFEKIESGKMDLEHIDFDLHRIINGIVMLMSGHAAAKGITLKVNMDPNVPRYIIGDPIRLRQVLLNLAGNSIKFTNQGGVTLHVKLDPTADNRSGTVHRIRFAVEDTGVGISKEAQKNLFNPFAQADSSVSRKFGGTGLGLAISQRLIEAMNGHIHIDSTEGHGSTFFFTLIVERGTAEAAENQVAGRRISTAKPEKSLKILIVEDNEINQKLLKEFVQRMGHETDLCASGEDALRAIEKKSFDMILMDIELPGLSGMGATKSIRAMKNRQKAATPVIALTGRTMDEDIGLCYAANMNGHIAKPVDPRRLKAIIEKVISGKLDNPVELPGPDGSSEPVVPHSQAAPAVQPQKTAMPPAEASPVLKSDLKNERAPLIALALEEERRGEEAGSSRKAETEFEKLAASLNGSPKKSSPAGHDRNVFDTNALSGLKASMGAAGMKDLVDGLFATADQIVDRLAHCVLPGDLDEVTARAHELKGMVGNFGLVEMMKIAGEMEKHGRDKNMAGIEMLLGRLPEINERSKVAVQAWLRE